MGPCAEMNANKNDIFEMSIGNLLTSAKKYSKIQNKFFKNLFIKEIKKYKI